MGPYIIHQRVCIVSHLCCQDSLRLVIIEVLTELQDRISKAISKLERAMKGFQTTLKQPTLASTLLKLHPTFKDISYIRNVFFDYLKELLDANKEVYHQMYGQVEGRNIVEKLGLPTEIILRKKLNRDIDLMPNFINQYNKKKISHLPTIEEIELPTVGETGNTTFYDKTPIDADNKLDTEEIDDDIFFDALDNEPDTETTGDDTFFDALEFIDHGEETNQEVPSSIDTEPAIHQITMLSTIEKIEPPTQESKLKFLLKIPPFSWLRSFFNRAKDLFNKTFFKATHSTENENDQAAPPGEDTMSIIDSDRAQYETQRERIQKPPNTKITDQKNSKPLPIPRNESSSLNSCSSQSFFKDSRPRIPSISATVEATL